MNKQETLEEAAERTYQKGLQDDIDLSFYDGVRLGAKWQQEHGQKVGHCVQAERIYSAEDMQEYAEFCIQCFIKNLPCIVAEDWFKQFKNK